MKSGHSIEEYFSGFYNPQADYSDIIHATVPAEGLLLFIPLSATFWDHLLGEYPFRQIPLFSLLHIVMRIEQDVLIIASWSVLLGDALISWKCKKQDNVSKSFSIAGYRAMSSTCSEIVWLRNLPAKLGFPQEAFTPLYADNNKRYSNCNQSKCHECAKHIEIDCHPIHEALRVQSDPTSLYFLPLFKWMISSPKP